MNPAAKVGRNDIADRWRRGAKESNLSTAAAARCALPPTGPTRFGIR